MFCGGLADVPELFLCDPGSIDENTMATAPPMPAPTSMHGSVATTSSSSLNSYSPISTLEHQYDRPVGERMLIFVGTNPQCCLEGGVESILKLSGRTDVLASAESTFEESAEDDFDAFAFLNDNGESNGGAPANGDAQAANPQANGIGGFFRKVAASTSRRRSGSRASVGRSAARTCTRGSPTS